ncbi:TonB-linked SusC/RagA family outer membrane protein [Catalinimonas alkaloidigena]|uniref:SusC/RagA family TonB-linked outer membrane protein n=1 Tax=Catalinimonas alkaloidigena TaxID=1075417 RepID=UPI0024061E31|nr:SusC/RagA family TonB-linked outer membrane protein [Catalinimonas alkaloidigena]MDF9798719.1 TonB-linked SusC/RagA family outer membrane protein [Catalinimonas alkaloidigena]
MKPKLLLQSTTMGRFLLLGVLTLFCFNTKLLGSNDSEQKKSIEEIFIEIRLDKVSLGEAISSIEKETDFSFVYNENVLRKKHDISLDGTIKSLGDVLRSISQQTQLAFKRMGNNIHISDSKAVGQVVEEVMGAIPQIVVSGTVTSSSDGSSLPGVNVLVKGTMIGTVTDAEGKYSINVPNDDDILVFSSIGFTSQEIPLNGRSVVDISMEEDVQSLSEVVVVGYGTMRRSDVTGSVSSVTPKELVDRPVVNIGQALQNKVSGVQVIKQGAGYPGSNPQIRIRGTNSINSNSDPLFVVDGIVGVNNALRNINPQDILTMDILKDASATAIYGTRGANGVIIITTKRGEVGKVSVNYNGSMTLGTMQRHNYTVTADQFFYLYEQAFTNTPKYGTLDRSKDFRGDSGTGLSWSEMPHLFEQVQQGEYFMDLVGNDGNYYKPRFYSNWEDIAFENSLSHDHYVDVSGGSENAKYSIGLGHTNQDGLLLESYYKRINARFSTDIELNDWLGVSTNILYSRAKSARGDDQLRTVSETWPILPTRYPNDPDVYGIYAGKWSEGRDFPVGENWRNIVYTMNQRDGYYLNTQFTGGIVFNAQITPNLSFKTNLSVDNRSEDSRWFNGDFQGNRTSDARGSNQRWLYWQNENYFNYDKLVGNHSFSGMIGLSWSETVRDWVEARASNFPSNFYSYNNLNAGTNTPAAYSENQRSALNSYFARVNYAYNDKYMFTATGRMDGSSKFGPNNKYAFFPSVGVGWRISNEDFMAGNNLVSNLKIRASAGRTGNQEIGSFVTQRYINTTNVMFGDGRQAGFYPGSTGNPDLKWETTTQWDVGIDLGLFNNRVNIVADYYHKLTDDMLFNLPLPESTAPGSAFVNYGAVENTGVEVELATTNVINDNFSWDTRLTVSANRNEIKKLGPTGADVYVDTGAGNGTSVYRIGEPIGSFFGLNRMGVYSTQEAALAARYGRVPGDLKFEDVNQDGKIELISDGDVIGHSYPKFYGGFINTFSYRNFDANITIQFVGGVDKVIVHESAEDRQFVSGMVNRVLNAWRPDHQENTMVAQVRAGNAGARYDSFTDTHSIYNAAFIRGQSASLGYTFSNLIGINSLRVYFAMENFFLLTAIEMEGYDPEGSSLDKARDNIQNIDKYQYPNPTNFSLGVNVNF